MRVVTAICTVAFVVRAGLVIAFVSNDQRFFSADGLLGSAEGEYALGVAYYVLLEVVPCAVVLGFQRHMPLPQSAINFDIFLSGSDPMLQTGQQLPATIHKPGMLTAAWRQNSLNGTT